MRTGKPLDKPVADALLFNAIDMYENNRRVQRIKSRRYDGVIESSLEVIDYLGVPSVVFEALVGTDMWESVDATFIIRVDDLTDVEVGSWARMVPFSPTGEEE
jgi:hypothetical protein